MVGYYYDAGYKKTSNRLYMICEIMNFVLTAVDYDDVVVVVDVFVGKGDECICINLFLFEWITFFGFFLWVEPATTSINK